MKRELKGAHESAERKEMPKALKILLRVFGGLLVLFPGLGISWRWRGSKTRAMAA